MPDTAFLKAFRNPLLAGAVSSGLVGSAATSTEPSATTSGVTALPDYNHPPLFESTLEIRWATELEIPASLWSQLHQHLGADWRPIGNLGEIVNYLGDRQLAIDSLGFSYRWLGAEGGHYPHYEAVRDGFIQTCDALREFLISADLPVPEPTAWQVVYVNRVPQGTVWNTPADWGFFCPLAQFSEAVPEYTLMGFEGVWELVPEGGGAESTTSLENHPRVPLVPLVVEWSHHAGTASHPAEVIDLTLRAGGLVTDEVLKHFDSGRTQIVRAFQQLSSPAANAYWGLKPKAGKA